MAPSLGWLSRRPRRRAEGDSDSGADSQKPFRLLDLPKEIRLMIWEELGCISVKRQVIPLESPAKYVTLINLCIEGVGLLATCRFLNEEAGHILGPQMDKMLKQTPKVLIEAKYLIGINRLLNRKIRDHDVRDKKAYSADGRNSMRCIHTYRKGQGSLKKFRDILKFRGVNEHIDDDALKGFATFILRYAKHEKMLQSPYGLHKHPPIAVIIEIPKSFQTVRFTITIPIRRMLVSTLTTGLPGPRHRGRLTTRNLLVRQFAGHAATGACRWGTFSIGLMLKHVGDRPGEVVPAQIEHDFQTAVLLGVADAHLVGTGYLQYSGVVENEDAKLTLSRGI